MNFVFDIDGTLCFDGKTIDATIVDALDTLAKLGNEIIFASARPIRDLVPILPSHLKGGKLIGGNGCFISENHRITTSHFTPALVNTFYEIIEKHQLTYLADGEWDYAYTGSTEHPIYRNINKETAKNLAFTEMEKICKLVLFNPTDEVLQDLAGYPIEITHYKSENAIDISPMGINKVHGLRKLQIDEFIAFGNDSNDRCMFENAVYSVCIGENEVKEYASLNISKEEVAETILSFKNRVFAKGGLGKAIG